MDPRKLIGLDKYFKHYQHNAHHDTLDQAHCLVSQLGTSCSQVEHDNDHERLVFVNA